MNFKNIPCGATEPKDVAQSHQQQPLARQPSSVYSLTFDEFQSTLGKDFGSMNMDELLRSIWSAEETQALASAAAPSDASASGLQRQGSLTLPRTLSQKTVDEVWRDLIAGSGGGAAVVGAMGSTGVQQPQRQGATGSSAIQQPQRQGATGSSAIQQPQRQPTLGEMTLEEFLFRAGVVREDITQPVVVPPPLPTAGLFGDLTAAGDANRGISFAQVHHSNRNIVPTSFTTNLSVNLSVPVVNTPMIRSGEGMVEVADPLGNSGLIPGVVGLGGGGVTVAAVGSSPGSQLGSDILGNSNGDLSSSVSPVPYPFNGLRGKRSGAALEKVMERRQRRMIKNRESAARSRARKQAYTMELEAEVAKLKQQNEELQKKQDELMEMQKNKVLETMNQHNGPKRQCLRRTLTGPW